MQGTDPSRQKHIWIWVKSRDTLKHPCGIEFFYEFALDFAGELTGFAPFRFGRVEAEDVLSRQQAVGQVKIMEFGSRLNDRPSLSKGDLRNIIRARTPADEDDQQEVGW